MPKKFTVRPIDAAILEGIEERTTMRARTRAAIKQTYKSVFGSDSQVEGRGRISNRPFTKARRKLPNGRKWKDKTIQYRQLIADMTKEEFNDNTLREKTVKKIYKYNKGLDLADPMVRGGVQ